MNEEQKNPIILAETEEPARQLVQLSAEYDIDYTTSNVMLLTASIKEASVRLRRMTSDEEQRDFSLGDKEMDALCTAWTAFKHKQEQKAKAEDERLTQIVDEAYALAGPYIKIAPDGPNIWRISCLPAKLAEIGPVYGAERLLANVKEIHKRYSHLWNRRPTAAPTGGDAA